MKGRTIATGSRFAMREDRPDEASNFNVLKPRSKGPALLPPDRGQSRWSEPGNEIPAIRARALESIRREGRERGWTFDRQRSGADLIGGSRTGRFNNSPSAGTSSLVRGGYAQRDASTASRTV